MKNTKQGDPVRYWSFEHGEERIATVKEPNFTIPSGSMIEVTLADGSETFLFWDKEDMVWVNDFPDPMDEDEYYEARDCNVKTDDTEEEFTDYFLHYTTDAQYNRPQLDMFGDQCPMESDNVDFENEK